MHQLYDLAADALRLGRIVSCFPTERKHRDIKAIARNVSRHFERTVLCQYVNDAVHHFVSASDDCLRCCLVNEKSLPDTDLRVATSAQLPCGQVYAKDVVLMSSGCVCRVVDFWAAANNPATLFLRAQRCQSAGGRGFALANGLPPRCDRVRGQYCRGASVV